MREHRDEVNKIGDGIPFNRRSKKTSETERDKSVLIDHVVKENYVMDWAHARIVLKGK